MTLFIFIYLAVCIGIAYVIADDLHTRVKRKQEARAAYYYTRYNHYDDSEINTQQTYNTLAYLPHGSAHARQAAYDDPECCPNCCEDDYCAQHNHLFLATADDDAYQYWYGEADRHESESSYNLFDDGYHDDDNNDDNNDGGNDNNFFF